MSSLPADILADERLKALSPAKRAALEAMLLARKQQSAAADRITPRDASEKQALSFAEQRLWLLDQLEPSHPFYNMPLAARLAGDLDEAAFAEALQTLTDRHETLRYAYDTLAGEPRRRIADQVRVSPELIDLRGQSPSESEQAALLRDAARVPFDLSKPPLLRCHIYQLADDERIILLVMHHIVSDGWSMWVMLNELAALYEAALAGLRGEACAATLLPLPIQYSDYAVWQREQLSGERREKQIDYWRSRLADAPPSLELPTDYPRTPTQDFDGAVHDFRFSAELSEQIRQAAEATGATPFMLLMAAYQVWLARHTGRRDLCVGTVVAGRPRTELERLIGFFVNTLALRGDLTGDPTFGELVEQVRTETLGAFSHQDLPFEQVIEAVAPDRDRSHEALFQTALVVQNPPRDFARSEGLELTPLLVDNGTAKYDLTFFFWEDAGRWQGQIEYRTSLFEQTTIERFLATFQTLLADALSRQDVPASRLRLLDAEQQATLARWNQTEAPLEEPLLIHDVVLQQTQSKADDAAIRYQGKTTTYAELDEQSRQIAGKLQAAGVSVDDPVLVCLPRSAESVVAMLGIWRAGGVYVPVDLQSAAKRLGYLADDCGAKWVVTNQEVETPPDVTQLDVAELMAPADVTLSDPQLSPQSRAYVIYTSGSTGQPKGVEIEHRSIVNFVRAQTMTMGVTESDHVLHAMSPAFDGGLSVALLAIANGSTLVVADHEQTLDPAALTQLLTSEAVTVGKFTPALLATLDPTQLPGLKSVLSAGDLLTGDLAARWQPGRRFFNGYGPTEVTVGVSIYELPGPPTAPPPIGPPMPNMRAYVLDEHLQQVPIGVTGEICIGGAGVARGYLSRPDETAAKFLPDPFASANPQLPSPRMYRTGDLGRWRSDGVLEFVGRVDDQVQIRGYRVEPGEVTGALESLPEVSQAYTCVHSDPATGDRLVAYVVPASEHASAVHENSDATIGAVEGEHLKSWQTLMEQTHQATGALRDVEFDVTGWVSTFTGLPIPKEEMRAWAAATQDRVLELEPQDVLEIGCGGGLILLGVAPHCRSYVGTDFLARSIDQLSGVLDRKPEAWTKSVKLYKQPAHEMASGPLAGRLFDTIVLNSVVQYFPTVDYLLEVLQAATKLLRPGGKILLGDLRNLQLQEAMAAAVEMRRADAGLSRRELLGRVESRIRHEEELLISPELFAVLGTALPRLSRHTLQLETGGAANELTRYRYDVVLHFDEPADQSATKLAVIDASAGVDVMETVAKFAASDQSAAAICDIENPRVAADVAAWRRLRDAA
ncbi:MAG: amino acid adenylation domain-containing protein, partial [Planctomycetota bacterium]